MEAARMLNETASLGVRKGYAVLVGMPNLGGIEIAA